MSKRTKLDMGLIGYDELFMNDKEREENRLPKIYSLPLSEIDDSRIIPSLFAWTKIWSS